MKLKKNILTILFIVFIFLINIIVVSSQEVKYRLVKEELITKQGSGLNTTITLYSYNSSNKIGKKIIESPTQSITITYKYDDSEKLIEEVYKSNSGETRTTKYVYNLDTNLEKTIMESSLGNTETTIYNSDGNIKKKEKISADEKVTTMEYSYSYDLEKGTTTKEIKLATMTFIYVYNSNGDEIYEKVHYNKTGKTYTYKSKLSYKYDDNGLLIEKIWYGPNTTNHYYYFYEEY